MPKKKTLRDRFSDLVVTDDDSLIAWVEGTERYAAKVIMDEENRL